MSVLRVIGASRCQVEGNRIEGNRIDRGLPVPPSKGAVGDLNPVAGELELYHENDGLVTLLVGMALGSIGTITGVVLAVLWFFPHG